MTLSHIHTGIATVIQSSLHHAKEQKRSQKWSILASDEPFKEEREEEGDREEAGDGDLGFGVQVRQEGGPKEGVWGYPHLIVRVWLSDSVSTSLCVLSL